MYSSQVGQKQAQPKQDGMAKPSSLIQCHSNGLIRLSLQIVATKWTENRAVHWPVHRYTRLGGLKLIRSYFMLLLSTVVISEGVKKHSSV